MRNIRILMRKEWKELRQQPGLLISLLALPLLFTAMATVLTLVLGAIPDQDTLDLPLAQLNPAYATMSVSEVGQSVIGAQMSLLFTILPIMLPSVIASYSIVGEKAGRTLEPLLATPVRTWELLVGKGLLALLPALTLTWLGAGIFAVCLLAGTSPAVSAAVLSPAWFLLIGVCGPLIAIIAVAAMVAISARVNDPRTAQQYSAIGIVPFMVLFLGQLSGLLILGAALVLVVALVLAIIAALAVWGAVQVFERERILTRWK